MVCIDRPYPFKGFKGYLPDFTWSILERFVPNGPSLSLLKHAEMNRKKIDTGLTKVSLIPSRAPHLATPSLEWQSQMLPSLDYYLYAKGQICRLVFPVILLIKESYNLIGQVTQLAKLNKQSQVLTCLDGNSMLKN